jgi:hypothetical protein
VVNVSPTGTIPQGQSISVTAKVSPNAAGGPTPTGTLQFALDNIVQGTPVTLSDSQAQFTPGVLSPGGHTVTASYSGDTNYAASVGTTSPVVQQLLVASANPATISVSAPGQSGSTTITLTAVNGFSGSAPLSPSLCVGLPSESSCSFNPSIVTLSANGSATTTLTVTTTAKSAALRRVDGPDAFGSSGRIFPVAALLAACLLLAFAQQLRFAPRGWAFLLVLSAAAIMAASASCGGGSGSTGGGGTSNPGTPAGTTSLAVTITVTNGSQSVPVTVPGLLVSVQ